MFIVSADKIAAVPPAIRERFEKAEEDRRRIDAARAESAILTLVIDGQTLTPDDPRWQEHLERQRRPLSRNPDLSTDWWLVAWHRLYPLHQQQAAMESFDYLEWKVINRFLAPHLGPLDMDAIAVWEEYEYRSGGELLPSGD